VSKLVETLVAELERPRELSSRVLNYIEGTYGIDHDAIGGFLTDRLPHLEDYEIDLVLSPVFTPKLADQAVVAAVLRGDSLSREAWPVLIRDLVARPTRARLVTPDGQAHPVELREVTVERFVHRLRLEGGIPELLLKVIDAVPSADDRPTLYAIARRAAWENAGVREILRRYLETATRHGTYSLNEALALLDLVEGRKPSNVEDLLARIPVWRESLRQQVDATAAGKPFFHEGVRMMHGLERDQRGPDDPRMSAKEMELAFLGRLQQLLGN
jgi:hypothetical protein